MLTRVERVLALKNIELFHDIPGEVLADIAALLEEETFEKGQYIVNEGDLGKELYMIVKGEVEVVAGCNVVAVMKEGAGFGEMALIDSQPRSADIIAKNDVLVLKWKATTSLRSSNSAMRSRWASSECLRAASGNLTRNLPKNRAKRKNDRKKE